MMASRELDAEVAEKVMGWTVSHGEDGWFVHKPGRDDSEYLPPFSTEISAAWDVVVAMCMDHPDHVVRVGYYPERSTCEVVRHGNGFKSHAEATTPLAICVAALKCPLLSPQKSPQVGTS